MSAAARQTKFVFVTGGVLSGVGKGITAASLGTILKARGLKVSIQKCDPYLNVDAGTLNPAEHGECFVTKDGAETDLDLGHYERFLDNEMTQASSLMSGRVLNKLITDERSGKYLGKTVQIIPHVTNAIQEEIIKAGEGSDVHIVEIGGTVGDYEGLSFLEAIRELGMRVGRQNCIYMHVVYIPFLGASKEYKTKPAQLATRELMSLGIVPDMMAARSEKPMPHKIAAKLSAFCGVPEEAIALLPNASTVYEVPLTLEEAGWGDYVVEKLGLNATIANLLEWRKMVERATASYEKTIKVALVAKYLDNDDTYMSVVEALKSASWAHGVNLELDWVDAEAVTTENSEKMLKEFDGIVVPGGFGSRALEGKIAAAMYALQAKKPYLGLCLGMQMGVIAAARLNGLSDANTTECDPNTTNPIIDTMRGQDDKLGTGGTMRLGDYVCEITPKTVAHKWYGKDKIVERHRHRYEFNNAYLERFESWGMRVCGRNPETGLVEMIEAADHPFFLASQFHPEFKSRPTRPHPMFAGFIDSMIK